MLIDANMSSVTHTTLSPDTRMRTAVLIEPGRIVDRETRTQLIPYNYIAFNVSRYAP